MVAWVGLGAWRIGGLGLAVLGIAGLGCGGSHERGAAEDAGRGDAGVDAGPEIATCEGIFEASEGTSCPEWLSCEPGDLFCTRRHATCPEGRLVFDETDRWVGPEGASCSDVGEVALSGTSASGDVVLGSGVASFSHAFAVYVGLVFFEGEDVTACGTPRLHVELSPFDLDSYVGEHEVVATLAVEDAVVEVPGSVTIDSQERLDDGRVALAGDVDLAGPGATISGTFRIAECFDLDRGGP